MNPKLFKNIREQRMTAEEKAAQLNKLRSFMTSESLPVKSKFVFPSLFHTNFIYHKALVGTFSFLLIFTALGSTMIGANYSLPGDILYPVKISINEKVESFVATTPEQKVQVETNHIELRLKEAESLSANNKLDDSRKVEIENRINTEIKEVKKQTEKLDKKTKERISDSVNLQIVNHVEKHKEIAEKIIKIDTEENQDTIMPKLQSVEDVVPATTLRMEIQMNLATETTEKDTKAADEKTNKESERKSNKKKTYSELREILKNFKKSKNSN